MGEKKTDVGTPPFAVLGGRLSVVCLMDEMSVTIMCFDKSTRFILALQYLRYRHFHYI